MPKFLDYMISNKPIRIVDPKIDKSKLHISTLTITAMGHLPGRTLQRKNTTFDSWAFLYIVGGKGYYQVNDGPIQQVEEGSLFFVYPGAVFHYGPDDQGYWDEYHIRFEGSRIGEWLDRWLHETDTVKQVGMTETIVNKLEAIFSLLESGVPINVDRSSLMLESLLFECILNADKPQQKLTKQNMNQLLEDIAGTIYQLSDANIIAKRNHISIPTLRRMISQYSGYPFNEYVHRMKIAEAKRLLLNTDWPIQEVSDALCYKDVYYFSRVFKKYAGISPHNYRKSY